MIQVLRSWLEVGEATMVFQRLGLPIHITVQKNWDQYLVGKLMLRTPKDAAILDLGCGSCATLKLLARFQFSNLTGIDFHVQKSSLKSSYKLLRGDVTRVPFADRSFDRAISISTIEHGVDPKAFFREAQRILRPDGLLFVTTDYWEEKIEVEASLRPFGLSWQIFSRKEIEELIAVARSCGFRLDQDAEIPPCATRTVTWHKKDYTFIALTFRRESEVRPALPTRPAPAPGADLPLRVLYLENSVGDSFKYYFDVLEALEKQPGVEVDVLRRWIANPRMSVDVARHIEKQKRSYDAIVFGFGWTNCGSGPPAKAICPPEVPKFIILNKEYDGLEAKLRWIRENQIQCAFTVHHDFERYAEQTGVPFVHLPFAADPEIFKDYGQPFEYDFGFTGIVRPEQTLNWRSRIHQSLGDRKLWGDTKIYFSEHLHDDRLEYAQRMNRARIWLSTTSPADLVGPRYYEVMLTGTTLLACNRFDYLGFFEEDENCIMFETLEELAEKVRFYSDPSHEAQRARMVAAAQQRVLEQHTWRHRGERLARTIRGYL